MGCRVGRRPRPGRAHVQPDPQAKRRDPRGDYVRRHVPELARLDGKQIHEPWKLGGVDGYPLRSSTTRTSPPVAGAESNPACSRSWLPKVRPVTHSEDVVHPQR
ncbi:MAG: hypothetical protein H0X39_06010 [Actinobacteria bacterium]|nr:hypothetical protein [Actinomycetota bacterium]